MPPATLEAGSSLDCSSQPGAFSLVSYNILLPNSVRGWWVFKFYQPSVPDEARAWAHRQRLLREGLLGAMADIVCLQEVVPDSFEQDLAFLTEAGYDHALHRKSELRCATFWRRSRFALASEPQHKDRSLITSLRTVDEARRLVHVVNVHLKAGPEPARRLRQVFEALEQTQKEARKVGQGPVVICGDFNSNPAGSAVQRLLIEGEVRPELREDAYPEQELTSKPRSQPFGRFDDAYAAAFGPQSAPPTLLLPDRDAFFADEQGALRPAVVDAFRAIFQKFSGGQPTMDRAAVDRWISTINRRTERGSEWDKALEIFAKNGAETLSEEDLVGIYVAELREGKPWGVFHDLDACGALPGGPPPAVFEGRFDQIHHTPSLSLSAVVSPLNEAQRRQVYEQKDTLPNAWHPSDHLPLGAVFRW